MTTAFKRILFKRILNVVLSLAIVGAGGASAVQAFSTDTTRAEVHVPGLPPTCAWLPEGKPKCILLCIHGLGLHMGSYNDFGESMKREGFGVYATDVRGFGSWYLSGKPQLDFDGSIADISATIKYIHQQHPDVPLYLLGESMGGAVALQAAAQHQTDIQGLICSVPSGDRKSGLGSNLHVGLHVLAGGFEQRFDVGSLVISYATNNPEHRRQWANDPRSRKMYSPAELIGFQNFMNKNFAAAESLRNMPVLFVQGTNDQLVRGSGNWEVYDKVLSPNKQLALSMAAEHLIFENGQCDPQDQKFLLKWIDKAEQQAKQPAPEAIGLAYHKQDHTPVQPAVDGAMIAHAAPSLIKAPSDLAYWIELKRDGKTFRCNNKMAFHSGDEIRFHVSSGVDGYAYIMMQQGSSGDRALLFPENNTGLNNQVKADADCAIPTRTFLKFDEHPGIEKINVVFSRRPVDVNIALRDPKTVTAYVSSDRSGAKDLVSTRIQLGWDDPSPVLMPGSSHESSSALAMTDSGDASLVRVACQTQADVLALDIALEHN